MTKVRYAVVCRDGCGRIDSDAEDGLFPKAAAHRRAGFHEGSTGHEVEVDGVSKTPEYQCPICHTTVVGEREKEEHARTEPGLSADSMRRV